MASCLRICLVPPPSPTRPQGIARGKQPRRRHQTATTCDGLAPRRMPWSKEAPFWHPRGLGAFQRRFQKQISGKDERPPNGTIAQKSSQRPQEANPLLSVLQLAWSEGILQQRRLRNASTRAQTQLSSKALKQQPKHSTARLMFAAGLEMVSVPWGRDAIVQETACGRLVGLTPWQTTEKDHQSFAQTVQVGHSLHASMQRH